MAKRLVMDNIRTYYKITRKKIHKNKEFMDKRTKSIRSLLKRLWDLMKRLMKGRKKPNTSHKNPVRRLTR